jgi:hypothetical protein
MFAWPCNAAKMVVDGLDFGPSLPIVTRGVSPLGGSLTGGQFSSISGFVKGFFVARDTCFWVTKLIGYNIAIVVAK